MVIRQLLLVFGSLQLVPRGLPVYKDLAWPRGTRFRVNDECLLYLTTVLYQYMSMRVSHWWRLWKVIISAISYLATVNCTKELTRINPGLTWMSPNLQFTVCSPAQYRASLEATQSKTGDFPGWRPWCVVLLAWASDLKGFSLFPLSHHPTRSSSCSSLLSTPWARPMWAT